MLFFRSIILAGFVVAAAGMAQAQQSGLTATNGAASIDVIRSQDNSLRIDIKITGGAKLNEVKATLGQAVLPLASLQPYPTPQDTSSVLFLIDTSSALRQPAIDRIVASISDMLKLAKPYRRFGLASFDADLAIKVALASDPALVAAALPQIKATGMTTELYRSLMTAITRLAVAPASRRAIFLFSDGLAEDSAYKFEDAVAAARATDIAIYTFGFARTPAQKAALQSLRRLAEDTGGLFFAADDNFALPPNALAEPFESLDSGGRAVFTMTPEQFAAGGVVTVQVGFSNGGAVLDVTLPGLPPPADRGWSLWIRQPSGQVILALGGVFVVGLGALLIDGYRRRRAAYLKRLAAGHFDEPEAWLEFIEDDGRHVGVTGNLFRIGRNRDNDLVLKDSSVAAHHAVILKASDGGFTLTDLRSGKGISVNLSQVQNAALHNGDMVEIGGVRLRFRATGRGVPDHVMPSQAAAV